MQVGLVLRRATWGARFKARSGSRLPMLISVQQLRRLMIAPSSLFWGDVDHRRALANPILLGHRPVGDDVPAEDMLHLLRVSPEEEAAGMTNSGGLRQLKLFACHFWFCQTDQSATAPSTVKAAFVWPGQLTKWSMGLLGATAPWSPGA